MGRLVVETSFWDLLNEAIGESKSSQILSVQQYTMACCDYKVLPDKWCDHTALDPLIIQVYDRILRRSKF
ncbi:hypothetical protein BGZ75_000668, partial [Mortierella antarctica]